MKQPWFNLCSLQAVLCDQLHLDDLLGTANKPRRVLVCRRKTSRGRIKIELRYEGGQLVECELLVAVPPKLEFVA